MTLSGLIGSFVRQHWRAYAVSGVVLVSHRLATVLDADLTLVLRHGRIAEQGRHVDLLAATLADGHPGWYATQWRVQQLQDSLALTDAATDLATGGAMHDPG